MAPLPITAYAAFVFEPLHLAIIAIAFIILAIIILKIVKKLVVNSILGVVALFLISYLGVKIPITIFTFIVVAILGLFGAAGLVILHLLGVKIP